MSDLRELILAQTEKIRVYNTGFPRDTMRWSKISMTTSVDGKNKHISEVDFTKLDDSELFYAYNLVMSRHSRQM